MSISLKTRQMLWGRAAHRCSYSECRRILEVDDGRIADPSLIGQIAHIVAEKPDGPRGASEMPIEQRSHYSNLILLCPDHHKLIDDHPDEYPVSCIQAMKEGHEAWVKSTLDFNPAHQHDDEVYAMYVEDWVDQLDLQGWDNWTSWIMAPNPEIRGETHTNLTALDDWLFRRVWPRRYARLEHAFLNFHAILHDLLKVLNKHLQREQSVFTTRRFYKITEYNNSKYHELFEEYESHCALVQDLMLELGRGANRVCEEVRESLDKSFRLKEGVLILEAADGITVRRYRPEYSAKTENYPGLKRFQVERAQRNIYFGTGIVHTSLDD